MRTLSLRFDALEGFHGRQTTLTRSCLDGNLELSVDTDHEIIQFEFVGRVLVQDIEPQV